MLQVNLHFTENALRLIAKKAMAKNTGARGLRAILENILTEAMFQVYYGVQLDTSADEFSLLFRVEPVSTHCNYLNLANYTEIMPSVGRNHYIAFENC